MTNIDKHRQTYNNLTVDYYDKLAVKDKVSRGS